MTNEAQLRKDLDDANDAWTQAIKAWDAARCAEWHPGKDRLVGELRMRCVAARRAHGRAWTALKAPHMLYLFAEG